jgi:hypothetical protein
VEDKRERKILRRNKEESVEKVFALLCRRSGDVELSFSILGKIKSEIY